jgi:hypothetical protein
VPARPSPSRAAAEDHEGLRRRRLQRLPDGARQHRAHAGVLCAQSTPAARRGAVRPRTFVWVRRLGEKVPWWTDETQSMELALDQLR